MNKLLQKLFCIALLLFIVQASIFAQSAVTFFEPTVSEVLVASGATGNAAIPFNITFERGSTVDPTSGDLVPDPNASITFNLVAYSTTGNVVSQTNIGSITITAASFTNANDPYDLSTSYTWSEPYATLKQYSWVGYSYSSNTATALFGPIGLSAIPIITVPVISSALTASGTQNSVFTPYHITTAVPANSYDAPSSYTASGLPTGLSINTSTGVISGTPSVYGTFNVTIGAKNDAGTGTAVLKITIIELPPVITSAGSIANVTDGYAINPYTITATNSPTGYGATNLPSGLSINTTTGVITGTPTVFGTYNVTISATNAGGTGTQSLTLNIAPPNPTYLPPSCISNTATSFNIDVTNYPGPGTGTYTLQSEFPGSNFLTTGTIPVTSYSGSNCVLTVNIPSPLTTNVLSSYYLTFTSTGGIASVPSGMTIGNTIPPVIIATANGAANTVDNTTLSAYLNGHDCVPMTGGTPTDFVLSVVPAPGVISYTWSYGTTDGVSKSNGWTSVGQTGTTPPYTNTGSILTIPSASFNNQIGVIVLTVMDACGHTTPYTYTINRYLPTTISANITPIITFNTTCTTPGSPIIASLATTGSLQANSNPVTWSNLPVGWTTHDNGDGTTTITPSTTAAEGSYTINAVVGNGADGAACNDNNSELSYTININSTTVPTISGVTTCLNPIGWTTLTASPALCSTCSYTWALASGAGTLTPTGNSATYKTDGNPASITATYQVAPGCGITSAPIATTAAPARATLDKGLYCGTGSPINITVTNYPGVSDYVLEYFNVGSAGYTDFLNAGNGVEQPIDPVTHIITITPPTGSSSTATGAYMLFYNSPTCGLPVQSSSMFATLVVGTTPANVSVTGTTNCLSTFSNTTLTASQTLCSTCSYTWATTPAGIGTLSGQTGSTTLYRTNGQVATIAATYTVGAGCSITSTPVTILPSVPIVTLPSCVGNAPNATEYLTVDNYSPASNYNYAFKYMNIGSPSYTDFLQETTSVTPTLSSGGTWVIPIKANPTNYNNESMGIYQLINNSCPGSPETTPYTFGAAPPFTVSYTAATKTLLADPTYAPYTWYNLNTGVDLASSSFYTLTSPSSGANDYFSAQATIGGCTYSSSYLVPNYIARPEIVDNGSDDQEASINVYPNPSQGNFSISIPKIITKAAANVYDYTGKLVRTLTLVQGTNQINATNLASGEYDLIIMVDGQSSHNKIIIAK